MGDPNQELILQMLRPSVSGPIIEVGSKNYGHSNNFRVLYPDAEYVGVDLEPGDGVDAVLDLEDGIGDFRPDYFDFGISCSALEHTPRPWKVAENLSQLIRPGGQLYLSVPWVWRYHPFPDDYFRFSFRAVKILFPGFKWLRTFYSTTVTGEIMEVTGAKRFLDNDMAQFKYFDDAKQRKYLPHLMVNMLGTRQ